MKIILQKMALKLKTIAYTAKKDTVPCSLEYNIDQFRALK